MSERARVCIVIPSLDVGGTERQALYLATGLAEDFDVSIVCTRMRGRWADRAEAVAPVHVLGLRSGWDLRGPGRLRRAFLEHRPDIVQTFLFGFDHAANVAARRAGVPVVVSSRRQRATWKKGRHLRLQRKANDLVDAIVANSESVADFASGQEGWPRDRYTVIYNGVEEPPESGLDPRVEMTIPRGVPVVGMVANYAPEKDHELFVAMAEQVHRAHPDAHFVLVGDGPLRAPIQRRVMDAELGDHFRFETGRDDARVLYPGFDVLVVTSKTEGLPNTVLEAMIAGVPVAAAAVGGVPEAIEEAVTGRLIASRRPEEFSDAVIALIRDPATAKSMGARAAEVARARFRVDAMVDRYRSLYRELLARDRGGN